MPLLVGVLALVGGCLLGWGGRYLVIEPHELQVFCTGAFPPAWCAMREAFITLTFQRWYGPIAIAGALVAWVTRGRTAAMAAVTALFFGGLGLYLYDTGLAAAGVLLALLRLPRVGEDPPDPREFTA